MATCDACGREESMPYHCRHCGGTYCAEHRLPESHDCPGLDDWGDDGVFDSGFDDSVAASGSDSVADRFGVDTAPGGWLGYFRNNMTFVFLGAMWITFLFQFLLFPLFGVPLGGSLWRAVFVLSPANPEYVWTWVTSVFAHGGFGHIAINSIVIYFFGQLVEDSLGTKRFTALFLLSGVLAGLGQIAISALQSPGMATGVLGASGAGLAIMGVLTVLNPGLRVYLYFVLPVPLWAVTGFYVLISVLGVFGQGIGLMGGNVADAAHLIGLGIGLAYGQYVKGDVRVPRQLQFGAGGGPGGPGGPGRRGPF